LRGLDYAGGIPPAAAISAAGYRFVVRYLTPGGPALPGKLLTRAEYASLIAAGVAVTVNWETSAIRMKGGHDAGVADARDADAAARKIGHPSSKPIYFSADWDTTPADQIAIDAYLRGAAEVLGPDRVGVYGSYYVVKRCLDNGTARWAWQTLAWSGGQTDPRAHIFQRIGTVFIAGVPCDINESNADYFGQHVYAPPAALGVLDMPAGEWVTTPTPSKHKVTFPVGPKVSSLVDKGWLGIDPDQVANLSVTARGGGAVLAAWNETAPADRRWWKELPDGTETCTVFISTPLVGVAGWCLELKARA
jgi:hypothetical protein